MHGWRWKGILRLIFIFLRPFSLEVRILISRERTDQLGATVLAQITSDTGLGVQKLKGSMIENHLPCDLTCWADKRVQRYNCSFAGCRILVPWPGIEPVPPAVEAQSLNHWTAREVPLGNFEDTVINTDCETCTVSGNSTGLRIRVCILAVPIAD